MAKFIAYRTSAESINDDSPSDWLGPEVKHNTLWDTYYAFRDGQPGTILKQLVMLFGPDHFYKVYRVSDFKAPKNEWKLVYKNKGR
jgi:hypothetical protein